MPALRPITLVEQVVDAFVKAAAEGQILPGDRIVEADLAKALNVSRVPVREALRLLESQGIVVNSPYRGMRHGCRRSGSLTSSSCAPASSSSPSRRFTPPIAATARFSPRWKRRLPA